jgi:YbbR domain-containing protein
VRGAADALGRLAPGDVIATVELSSAQAGRRLFHISPDRVKAPFAVDVMQVTPASVVIRFEPSATRLVPVHPSTEGETAPGFIVGDVVPDPKMVEIVGPESTLRHVTEAITEPVWVGGAKIPIRATVPLGVAEQGVRLKTARSALVRVDIVQAPNERRLSVPVRLRNLSTDLSAVVEPRVVSVRARGGKPAIDRLKETSVVAYVDVDGIGEGDFGLPVRLEPIAGIGLDQLDPMVVHIHIN